jgi:hypothetical protein
MRSDRHLNLRGIRFSSSACTAGQRLPTQGMASKPHSLRIVCRVADCAAPKPLASKAGPQFFPWRTLRMVRKIHASQSSIVISPFARPDRLSHTAARKKRLYDAKVWVSRGASSHVSRGGTIAARNGARLMARSTSACKCSLQASNSKTPNRSGNCVRKIEAVCFTTHAIIPALFQALFARITITFGGSMARMCAKSSTLTLRPFATKTCGRNGCTSGRSQMIAMCVNAVLCWAWVAFVEAVAVAATYGFSTTIVPFFMGCQYATDVSSKFRRSKVMPGGMPLHWKFHSCHPICAFVANAIPRRPGGRFWGANFGAARRPLFTYTLLVAGPKKVPDCGPKKGAEKWCTRLIFSRNYLRRNCIMPSA